MNFKPDCPLKQPISYSCDDCPDRWEEVLVRAYTDIGITELIRCEGDKDEQIP